MSVLLSDFKDQVKSVVRPNRFEVIISPPSIVLGSIDATKMRFHAQSASLPDRTFNEISIKYYGMDFKLPAGETTQDLVVSFINDAEWDLRNFFESWANAISNRKDATKAYMDDLYTGTTLQVNQLGFDGSYIAGYSFFHFFPKIVDQIELNMETTDSVETFQVTFSYSYWRRAHTEGV